MLCREYVDKTLMEADRKEAIGIAILVVVLLVSPIIIILVKNAAATIQVNSDVTNAMLSYLNMTFPQLYAMNLSLKAKELKREKRKSDSLLFQMLPPSVAMQLKQTQQVRWYLLHTIIDTRNAGLSLSLFLSASLTHFSLRCPPSSTRR